MTLRIAGSASKPNSEVGQKPGEEVQGVRLEELPVVHEPAHLLGRGGELLTADEPVDRLGGAEVVAHGADAAEPLDGHGHLPEHTALDEPLEAPELDDVEPGLGNIIVFVEQQRHLPVPFDTGDGSIAMRLVAATIVGAPL